MKKENALIGTGIDCIRETKVVAKGINSTFCFNQELDFTNKFLCKELSSFSSHLSANGISTSKTPRPRDHILLWESMLTRLRLLNWKKRTSLTKRLDSVRVLFPAVYKHVLSTCCAQHRISMLRRCS